MNYVRQSFIVILAVTFVKTFHITTEDLEEPMARRVIGDNREVNVCFACGRGCKARLPEDLKSYFNSVKAVVNEAFSDMSITINFKKLGFFRKEIPLSKFTKQEGDNGLIEAYSNFWKKGNKFEKWMNDMDCGMGFLLASDLDKQWANTGKDGVAAVSQVCKVTGTGMVKTIKDTDKMGAILAHEIGHELGANHDCDVLNQDAYDNIKALASDDEKVLAAIKNVEEKCVITDCLSQNFVMKTSPTAESPYPSKFSECSKASIEYFLQIGQNDKFQQLYDSHCILH